MLIDFVVAGPSGFIKRVVADFSNPQAVLVQSRMALEQQWLVPLAESPFYQRL